MLKWEVTVDLKTPKEKTNMFPTESSYTSFLQFCNAY